MTDLPFTAEDVRRLAAERDPLWLRALKPIVYGVVVFALAIALIVMSKVNFNLQDQLSEFTTVDECAQAYSRDVTEKQNIYLTDGFGGLLSALVDRDEAEIKAAQIIFQRTLEDSQAAVAERDAWVEAEKPMPCPI